MPESEEERRRRCIIDPSSCQAAGLTRESALVEELMGLGIDGGAAFQAASHILKHFEVTKKS